MEMMIVVVIIGLVAGITFPGLSSGLETLRMTQASDSLVSFLNGALNRAERRQEVIEVAVSPRENAVWMRSAEATFVRKLEMPSGIRIVAAEERRFLLLPGATVPRFGVELVSARGARRIVSVDPITGVPRVERLEERR